MAAAHGNRAVFAHCSRPVVMGGSALGRQAPRLPKEVYKQLVAELKTKLVPNFYMTVEAPRSFASKTSFGDVDLLASVPQKALDPMTALDSSESKQNGNIMHFEYQGYQVDVIEIDQSMLQLARFCYNYGDTGMIMGFFVRRLGLHFGLGGLTCCVFGTYKVNLSQDLTAILQFLDLDYESWEQGFETQEGMFRYLASSKYFRPYFFSTNNAEVLEFHGVQRQNGIGINDTPTVWNHYRRRLAERPMFQNWMKFVETLPETADRVDPEEVKAAALEYFGKTAAVQKLKEELDLRRRVKLKFHSKLTMEWTGKQVTGKALGKLTAAFKSVYPLTRLASMTQDEIKGAFIQFHQAQRQ